MLDLAKLALQLGDLRRDRVRVERACRAKDPGSRVAESSRERRVACDPGERSGRGASYATQWRAGKGAADGRQSTCGRTDR